MTLIAFVDEVKPASYSTKKVWKEVGRFHIRLKFVEWKME